MLHNKFSMDKLERIKILNINKEIIPNINPIKDWTLRDGFLVIAEY